MSCKCQEKTIKVDIVKHSEFVTMERNGDLIDLNFCGLNKIFNGDVKTTTIVKKFKVSMNDWKDDYKFEEREVEAIKYKKGDIFRVSLGFAMRMPEGKKAEVYQRSGTRKNFGVLLTNHVGQIDNLFQGTNDIWMAEFYAIEDGVMAMGDRILQFEIVDVQPEIIFNHVETLSQEDRGGYGSSGV